MAKEFLTLLDAYAFINQQISDTLQNEVADFVKGEISASVETEVYSKYSPIHYRRRGLGKKSYGLGGLAAMKHRMIDDNTLEVWDDAQPANSGFPFGDLAPAIEFGYGKRDQPWNEARPFIAPTKERLRDGRLKRVLKDGLKSRGVSQDVNVNVD